MKREESEKVRESFSSLWRKEKSGSEMEMKNPPPPLWYELFIIIYHFIIFTLVALLRSSFHIEVAYAFLLSTLLTTQHRQTQSLSLRREA